MKIGIEVEGRLKGISTIFMDDIEVHEFVANMADYISKYEARCVYISYPMDILSDEIQEISKKYYVTVETDNLSTSIPDWVDHIIYCFRSNDMEFLRPTDSIKVHSDPNNVIMATIETMHKTIPSDFVDDMEIV